MEQQKLDTNYHINRQLFVIVLISPVVAQFGAEPKTTIWGMESRRWRRKALVQRKGPGSLTGGPGLLWAGLLWAPPHPLLSRVNN